MPGLLRGVARTAVIAGTASAVNGRVQRRQAEKFADRDAAIYADRNAAYQQQMESAAPPPPPPQAPPPPAAPAAAAGDDVLDQLTKLGALRDSGVLTDEEFAAQKAKILGG
jgi:hypothetical protein